MARPFAGRFLMDSDDEPHSADKAPPAASTLPANVELSFYQRKLLQRVAALFRHLALDVVLAALTHAQWSEAAAIEELRRPAAQREATQSNRPVKDSEENDDEPLILRCAEGAPREADPSARERALEQDVKELCTLVDIQAQVLEGLEARVEKALAAPRLPFSRETPVLLPVAWCRQHLRPDALEKALRGRVFRPRPL